MRAGNPLAMKAELLAAFTLLTRLPIPAQPGPPPELARCLWAYPLVGAAIGAIAAAAYACLARLGAPPALASVWALAAAVLATGALHEDGVADTADGFGGATTIPRKLEIMRDSRIGTYGVLALLLASAIRVTAVADLAAPSRVLPALLAAAALSRGAIAIPLLLLAPARPDGLASSLRRRDPARAILAPAIALLIALILLPTASTFAAALAASAAAIGTTALARAQIGGYTGDVLGACAVSVECAVLTALTVA